jgi:phosphatidylinositol alpha-1,6-mannosyltransferase
MYVRLFILSLWLALTHRFDAIHAFRALPEGLVAWGVARLTFRPVVIYAHGEELTTWGKGGKFKAMCFALRHANKVIANSDFTRNELIKLGVAPGRITLIYPGVDIDHFRPELPCDDLKAGIGLAANQKLILSVGRLSRRKGFDMVIRSLSELLRQNLDVRYAMIGIGEDQEYLSSLARELGVSERVHLLGHVSTGDLPRWYNACDVFIMPNREINGDTEGFGMVFLEAAACGKPSIAGTAGGTGSAIVDGVTGLRVDGSIQETVTGALSQVLLHPEFSSKLGATARQRSLAEFSWEQVAEKTRRL